MIFFSSFGRRTMNDLNKPLGFFQDSIFQDYKFLDRLQKEILDIKMKYFNKKYNFIICAEHNHVYTIGRNSKFTNLLMFSNTYKKIPILKVARGGDVTYHGSGQLVCYLILDLFLFNYDINLLLRFIENIIIYILLKYKILSFRIINQAGIFDYCHFKKICSIGLKIRNYITRHGFSLNINNNLNYYNYIRPCGINKYGITSLYTENNFSFYIKIKSLLNNILSSFFNLIY
ncbi:Octanoyltransferase [Candidatus Karelsulcia muelleri]|uniref:lipoyl(octanoyl) transferase LipB n=1 Tax=Candidatus Karelsulcia muelleri TaxID=336810 RepID=UPI001FF19530|nr:lipoyl(octanoyl) transferase LipB [Candidatus Karelsulcia muelleri]UOQ27673.1 Octanoyltransferase [Candidatus Karelsulcia muelleri]